MVDIMSPATQANLMMRSAQSDMQASADKVRQAAAGKDMKKIEDAAHEFEAMFLTEMMRPMFEGIKSDDMFGGGKGEDMFQGLMVQEYGKKIADAGGIGLASHIKAAMIRLQEEANGNR